MKFQLNVNASILLLLIVLVLWWLCHPRQSDAPPPATEAKIAPLPYRWGEERAS